MNRYTLFIFVFCYFYAALRYHVGADIPLSEWMFILNKALAWTAFLFIGFSVIPQKLLNKTKSNRRALGVFGFTLGLIHMIITFFHLGPEHYGKLYNGDSLNFSGWMAISLGAVSALIYTFPLIGAMQNRPNTDRIFRLGKIGFILSTLHPAAIGFNGWLEPYSWPLYLPPITLLAFLTGIALLMIRLILSRGKNHSTIRI